MKKGLAGVAVLVVALCVAGCQGAEEGADNAAVQRAMDTFLQGKLSEGSAYEIQGVTTQFDYLHDGVKEKDGFFVSCADFKAGDDVYDVDYFVKAENGTYTVVKEMLHKKNGEPVDEVIWEQ